MKTLATFLTLLTASLITSAASAQDEFSRRGGYVQAAGTYAICDIKRSSGADLDLCSSLDNSFGMNLRGGYRFNRWISAEAELEWVHGYGPEAPSPSYPDARLQTVAYSINARFYPIEGRIQPFAIAGVGGQSAWLTDGNCSGSECDTYTSVIGRFGGGADVYITPHLALTAEFTYVLASEATSWEGDWFNQTIDSGWDPNYMSVSWGLMFRF